jgi:hypothetical protein
MISMERMALSLVSTQGLLWASASLRKQICKVDQLNYQQAKAMDGEDDVETRKTCANQLLVDLNLDLFSNYFLPYSLGYQEDR